MLKERNPMKHWMKQFDRNMTEIIIPQQLKVISGSIPKSIHGKYYKCGPGRFHEYGSTVRHPFDGDGFISAFHIEESKAYYQSRIIDTSDRKLEKKHDRRMFYGAFGTKPKETSWMSKKMMKNTANTNVIEWGSDLIIFNESGIPYVCDPSSLQTKGSLKHFQDGHPIYTRWNWINDILRKHKISGDVVGAHPKIVGDMVIFYTLHYSIWDTKITFYEMDEAYIIRKKTPYHVTGFLYLHDFVVTPSRYIFIHHDIKINIFKMGDGIVNSIEDSDRESSGEIHSVGRNNHVDKEQNDKRQSKQISNRAMSIISRFATHHVYDFKQNKNKNKMESESGFEFEFEFFSVCYKHFIDFEDLAKSTPYLVKTKWNENENNIEQSIISESFIEFPILHVDSAEPGFIGISSISSISRWNLDGKPIAHWDAGIGCIVGEPVLIIGNTREDLTYVVLIVHNYNSSESDLIILSAEKLDQKAVIRLPESVPTTLHGCWANHKYC